MGTTRRFSFLVALAMSLAIGIAGFAHGMDVHLAWDANTELDLAGYKIYYATSPGGPYNGTGSSSGISPIILPSSTLVPSNPEFTVRDLPAGTYYFVATAYDIEGLESGYSNEVSFSSAPIQYQLSAGVAAGSGTISPTSGTYNEGTVVTLSASPANGYRVLSWAGTNNNSSTSTTNTVTMNANKSVTVRFEQIPPTQYQLSAGVAAGSGAVSPTSGTYNEGTVVTLSASPANGYRVLSWTGTDNNSSTSTTNTVTMTANKSVTVRFEQIPNGTPVISRFEAGGQSGSTTVYTNSANRQIALRISASDDVALSEYLVLENQSDATGRTFYSISGAGQKTTDFTMFFVLNDSDGTRTLYAWVKDSQGVISAAASKPNVVLDRVAPVAALSYSKSNPYKAGDAILVTADFSDISPIAATPRISIDYAGTGSDLTGANMTQVDNKKWTYNLTIPSGNDGAATVSLAATDMAGNPAGTQSGSSFLVDNTAPTVVGSPVLDNSNSSITVTYSEGNMRNGASQGGYSFNDGLLLSGNGTDLHGDAREFRLPLNAATFQRFVIYTMNIGSSVTDRAGNPLPSGGRSFQINDTDNDGMADAWETQWFGGIAVKDGTADTDGDGLTDKEEYSCSRQNPSWGWTLNPLDPDTDKDGMPDGFEADNGLNPTDAADKDLDSDQDGWTNFQEYQEGTDPNDAGSNPGAKAPRVKTVNGKKGVMPRQNETAANDTGFAVLLESDAGIDTSDGSAVTLIIEDGENTYQRNLLQQNATQYALVQTAPSEYSPLQAAAASGESSVANEVWVVYYRSAETSLPNTWPFGAVVRVSVTARDVDGEAMKQPEVFTFEVESADRHSERVAGRPASEISTDQSGATVVRNSDTLATITFKDSLPVTPYFESEEAFDYPAVEAATVTVTMGPHLVFPEGATVFIPWRGDRAGTRGAVTIFGFDGETWQPIIDENGNDLTDGSWVVPGWNNGLSWQMVDDGIQSGVRIKVRHFSSFVGASGATVAETGTGLPAIGTSEASSGGGCFITTITN